jgi:hypothetical protein
MPNRKGGSVLLLALACILFASTAARAQDSDAPRQSAPTRAEVNHEVVIQLLVTAEGAEGAPRVPQPLDGVVRQLRATLPPSDFRLASTFVYRVRDGARFSVKTVGAGPPGAAQAPPPLPPTVFEITLEGVKLIDPASAQPSINIQQFRFGMRVPIQTASVKNDKGEGSYPVIQYEDVGVGTQLSVREGEPTLVGTLNSSRPGQLFAIVLTIRRAGK